MSFEADIDFDWRVQAKVRAKVRILLLCRLDHLLQSARNAYHRSSGSGLDFPGHGFDTGFWVGASEKWSGWDGGNMNWEDVKRYYSHLQDHANDYGWVEGHGGDVW